MAREKVSFPKNTPVRIGLAHPIGKETESLYGYGTQYYHSTTDGRACYLDPLVERQIAHLGIQPGEEVEICNGRDGWTTRRVGENEEALAAPKPPAPKRIPPSTSKLPPSLYAAPTPAPTEIAPATSTPATGTTVGAVYTACLTSAIDALIAARAHIGDKGLDMEFNFEDIRAVATTMFIHASQQHQQRGRAA